MQSAGVPTSLEPNCSKVAGSNPVTACSSPQALGPVVLGVQAWPGLALQCLDVLSGAGELLRRLVFSCVCAGLVPVAPTVGAVLAYLRLVHWWHAVWFDVCVVLSLIHISEPTRPY